jgi:tRNA pseudouridine55 synthase
MPSVYQGENDSLFRSIPSLLEITKILDAIVGEPELPIPAFSAKKVAGKKLYDLARKGEDLHRVGKMKIFEYSILEYSFPLLKIQIHVGS